MNSEKLYEQGLENDEKIIHLLPKMKQYPISRENFRTLFTGSLNMIIDELPFESDNFKIWYFDEDCYILHKESGILVSWYKLYHYGRCLECNKDLSGSEWTTFALLLQEDIKLNKKVNK